MENMMNKLVSTLIEGRHSIEFEPYTENLDELKQRINHGFVFVKFTGTQGGTELGINLDEESRTLGEATLNNTESDIIKIGGTCELNYHKVRCHAEVDLKTRKGFGYLELIDGAVDSKSPTLH